ncbi:MAG TPA: PAS domain-containing protein [Candidatus Angelobacter sp.]|nr:PAS domain-containing protein [Candidatus Angelobacter sp.]
MQYLLRRVTASLPGMPAGETARESEFVGRQSGFESSPYRLALLSAAVLAFAAHFVVLAVPSLHTPDSTWSNLIQLALGALAVLAMLEAGRLSARFARGTWFLAALAMGTYTAGQAMITYYGTALYQSSSPNLKDQFFFFWMVPLLAAAATDPRGKRRGFDWAAFLDFAQLVVLALALHLFAFGDAARWQADAQQMSFLKWKVRVIRDIVVLACLWGRTLASDTPQVRSLFRRLGMFYLAYSCADAIYLYVEARLNMWPGTWLDVLWSVPRLLAVVVALTWNWSGDIAAQPAAGDWRRKFIVLYWTPIVVPLAVLAVASHTLSSAPTRSAAWIVATFGIASLRLLATQFRQEHALSGLHRSNNLLRSVIEGTSEAIYLKDADGRYVLMNHAGARFVGRAPEEIMGKTARELFLPAEAEAVFKMDRDVMESGKVTTTELVLTAGEKTRTYLTTKNPYRDSKGQVVGVLGVSLDITERRAIEEQLRRAQRMESIGTFSGGIAHDFNNLLTVIKGYSQLALSQPQEPDQNVEYFNQINHAAGRASSLVSQLLAFSRKQILQPRVVNLNDIVLGIQSMLGRLIGEDVEVHARLCHELGAVKADPGQIEQVLMNLAANSRDAMPTGGKLTLETSNVDLEAGHAGSHLKVPPGAYVLLAVSDTGVGMDAQTQSRIFEPFFTTKPQGKGTGLGLATVYGIVRQSGGYIGLHSAPGMGSIFRIYLPRVADLVEPLAPGPRLVVPKGGHQTVLLVDDDLQLRRFIQTVLSKAGFNVLEAGTGEEAHRVAASHRGPIHLLLTDVVLPGGSGSEIAQRICGRRGETQLLYMSGYAGDTIISRGVFETGICFLQKPFTPDRLLEKVREVLQSSVDGHTPIPAPSIQGS